MAEYYGYAERDANAYVDWGKLGQNLTETVTAAYKLREDRKKQLDTVMEENYDELVNAPSGLNQDINKSITNHVGNTKQFLLQANKLLKSGVLRPEDYTLIMQNQKEDNKAIFDNAKNWQTAWAKIQDDVNSGKGSRAMKDIASDVASFGKFKDMDFMINPVTGRVNASKMNIGPNGERIKGESMTMQQLNVLMNQNIDKYDLTNHLVNVEKIIGDNTVATLVKARIRSQGSITSVTDKSTKDTFENAYATFAKEIKANAFNSMSILIDHQGAIPLEKEIDEMLKNKTITAAEATLMKSMAGQSYRLSTNAADKGKPDVIYYEDPEGDGSFEPILNDTQKKIVDKFVRDQFIGLIDRTEEKKATTQVSDDRNAAGIGQEQSRKDSGLVGKHVGYLLSGNMGQAEGAKEFFLNYTTGPNNERVFDNVSITNGVFHMRNIKTGQEFDFNLKDSNKQVLAEKIFSAVSQPTGAFDSDYYMQEAMKSGGKTVTRFEGTKSSRAESTPKQGYTSDDFITDIVVDEDLTSAKNLQARLPSGYIIETGGGFSDKIRIIKRNAKKEEIGYSDWFSLENTESKKVASEGIAAYLNANQKSGELD
jgi:hypothetical protein